MRFLYCFFSLFNLFNFFSSSVSVAPVTYAYMQNNVVLYNISGTQYMPTCTLPSTYFVAVMGTSSDDYLLVNYFDLVGYVNKNDVATVDYVPVNKYAVGTLSIDTEINGLNLRKTPNHTNGEIIATINKDATNIAYYGTTEGTTVNSKVGNEWYYIRYQQDDLYHYGYVYSGYVNVSKEIPANVIVKESELETETPETASTPQLTTLNDVTRYVFIGLLCVAAVFIVVVAFKKR